MVINSGEVYVPKEYRGPVVIVYEISEQGEVILRNISSPPNIKGNFTPSRSGYYNEADFLQNYERATMEQVIPIISNLEENREVIAEKISLLVKYAQSQPKSTKDSSLSQSDRGRRLFNQDEGLASRFNS